MPLLIDAASAAQAGWAEYPPDHPTRLSDVVCERVGDTVTLYNDTQVLEQVQVDPQVGELYLVRWDLEVPAAPTTKRVRVAPAP